MSTAVSRHPCGTDVELTGVKNYSTVVRRIPESKGQIDGDVYNLSLTFRQ